MKTIVRINWLLLLLFTAGCSNSSTLEYEKPGEGIHTIAYLKSLCPANGSHTIRETVILCGVVTANDLHGEFNKSIVIEDATGGVEISIDHSNLAKPFPLNTVVNVHCNGLAVGDYGGKVMLGAQPEGDYTVDRIPSADLQRYIRPATDSNLSRRAVPMTFGAVTLRDADRYVRFENVRFEEQTVSWCDSDPESGKPVTTRRTLIDATGKRFFVRTLGGCRYATEPVPQGTGSINGIIDYFNGEFSLRVTNDETDFRE